MAQPIAQPSLANELSTVDNVRLFAETIYRLEEVGFLRLQEYRVQEISIIKRYLLVQHEALVVEIHHTTIDDGICLLRRPIVKYLLRESSDSD